jgi:ABC-type polar amino acid transport system ATPase subunit
VIKITKLVKKHAGAPAPVLKGVDFSLETGCLAAILGSSGAGKTTLLRCLVGLESFDSGSIEIDGVVVRGTDGADEKARHRERARSSARRSGSSFRASSSFRISRFWPTLRSHRSRFAG